MEEEAKRVPNQTGRRREQASILLLHARSCTIGWVGLLGSHMHGVPASFAYHGRIGLCEICNRTNTDRNLYRFTWATKGSAAPRIAAGLDFLAPFFAPSTSSEHERLKEKGFCVVGFASDLAAMYEVVSYGWKSKESARLEDYICATVIPTVARKDSEMRSILHL